MALHVQSPASVLLSGVPPVVAGLVAGYVAQRGTVRPAHAGAGAGLLAAFPVVVLATIAVFGNPQTSGEAWLTVIVFASLVIPFLLLVLVLLGGLGLLAGVVAGRLGRLLDERLGIGAA